MNKLHVQRIAVSTNTRLIFYLLGGWARNYKELHPTSSKGTHPFIPPSHHAYDSTSQSPAPTGILSPRPQRTNQKCLAPVLSKRICVDGQARHAPLELSEANHGNVKG